MILHTAGCISRFDTVTDLLPRSYALAKDMAVNGVTLKVSYASIRNRGDI